MRGMKDSGIEWVGEIPKNWKMVRSKYNFKTHKNIVGYRVDDYERLALTMHGVVKRSKEDDTGLQPEKFETYQILEKNELVFKLIDLQNISTSRVGLSPYTGIVSPAYIILSRTGEVLPEYAEKWFLSMWQRQIFNHIGDDGVRSSLNVGDLLDVPTAVPPLDEQRAIATFLDQKCSEIDSLIADIKVQVETLELDRRSLVSEVVTKGLNPDVAMKDGGIEWIDKIPEHWDVHPVYYYFEERKNRNFLDAEDNLLSLSYGNIVRRDIDATDGLLPESFSTYNIVGAGDIIIRPTDLQNDKRSLRTGLVKEHGIITSAYIALKAIKPVNVVFFHYLLHAFDVLKVFYNMGDGIRQGLNFMELSHLMVFEPPRAEQDAIAEFLDQKCSEIDSLIADKKEQLKILSEYKKSLIYEYVTGKKEAPTA